MKITGVKNPGLPGSYDFDTNGNWPIDQARIVFPEQNMLLKIELSSRPNEKFVWHRKYLGLFYKLLREDGTLLISPPAAFNITNDRYWHIEEAAGGNILEQYTPVLEFGWLPHLLTFVAQGVPPYVIAYGSTRVEPPKQSIDPVMLSAHDASKKVLIKTANTNPSYILGGVRRLEPPPEPYPWRKLILWSALIAGTVLLFWMVWRLSRELGKPNAP